MPAVAQGPTYAHRILDATRRFADKPALRWKENAGWRELRFAELGENLLDLCAALQSQGIGRGDRVAIWLETSRPWVLTDLALQVLGAVTVTIYQNLPAGQAASIIKDAAAKALLTDRSHLEALRAEEDLGTLLQFAITVDADPQARGFEMLLTQGRAARRSNPNLDLELKNPAVQPEDLSAIIYTSGTTGEPKGVMLTHRNVLGNADDAIGCFAPRGGLTTLLHLPLAHVAARNTTMMPTLLSGSLLVIAEPERERLPQNFVEAAPTSFVTVPFVLDKFMSRILETISRKNRLQRFLFQRALSMGRARRVAPLETGGPVPPVKNNLLFNMLDRLVLSKVRARLGGRLQFIAIGGANSNRKSLEFFWSIGVPVYEAYGSTELTNLATANWPGDMKIGTVGRAVPGMEIKLAEDGEILVRGTNVMKGYWNRAEATAEVLEPNGWFHSGDIGSLDAEGYLTVLDRKKEIFALSTGKKVAPQAVENALKLAPCILNACAIGDKRSYMTALIVPNLEVIQSRLGFPQLPSVEDERVQELLRSEVKRSMEKLAEFEQVKRFILISEPFSDQNGLLTPILKLRRKPIAERYSREIELLYQPNAPREVIQIH